MRSPCTRNCKLADDGVHCLGCGRTIAEIMAFGDASFRHTREVAEKLGGTCGFIMRNKPVTIQDSYGCVLGNGHDGPHQFRNESDGQWYCWEYSPEDDCDVYWKRD